MHCYHHSDQNAVGICRGCNKALCHVCKDKDSHVMLCADNQSCHDHMAYVTEVQSQAKYFGKSTMNQAANMMKATPYYSLIASMTFCGLGVYEYLTGFQSVSIINGVFGLMLAGISAIQFWKRRS